MIESLVQVKDELAAQLADLRRLHAMSARLSSTLELLPIMEDALRTAVAVEGAQFGLLSLCDAGRGVLEVGASIGFTRECLDLVAGVPAGGGACGTCWQRRQRVVVEDVETDPLFDAYREVARRLGFRAVHSTPLITRSGKILGVLSVHFREPHRPSDRAMHFVDLCARQAADSIENARLYGDLVESDRAKNEFLAVLAHELRNPLAPIRNATQVLHLVDTHSDGGRSALAVIDRQVSHMSRLIGDLLDVARITGGKLELKRTRMPLAEVIAHATETSRARMEEHRQELLVSLPPAPIQLDADLTRLAQVIANLLHNASKFSPPGARIVLAAARQGSDVVITVRDTGVGIPADQLHRIFELFCQGPAADRTGGGLGIGLTLAKRLTEMHGGSVVAHSDGPGKGSEFVVRLPIAVETADRGESQAATEREPAPSGLRMLIVDDNRDAADSLAMLMRMMGNDVRVAYDGREALDVAAQFEPGVVLLDIGLPTLSGYEVARELRRQPHGARALLIATTGWSQPSDKEQSREAGFDHHLVKPVDPATLTRLLHAHASV